MCLTQFTLILSVNKINKMQYLYRIQNCKNTNTFKFYLKKNAKDTGRFIVSLIEKGLCPVDIP